MQEKPYLAEWDAAVRRNFEFYEEKKAVAAQSLYALAQNPFTSWRTVPQMRHRYQMVDIARMQ